ncbi:hypothetical protein EV702DRAFT_1193771 [Suillus placidus]|uniref:Uncharacterized protein n=1 Tax=Suillus placidus TaxID=48579 RepID=A0A9P7A2L7_9AGAM|nr:hypothetical protein EV702DRAFT_1193771 [Suillus placidus]
MRPFEFGAHPPNDDNNHHEFNFTSPVTPNPYAPDIRMPVPTQPWRGLGLPSNSEANLNASASGSGFQLPQSQLLVDANNLQHDNYYPQLPSSSRTSFQPQESLVNVNDIHYDLYQQLRSYYGPETSGYLASPTYHPILDERQPLGSFFPDFSQAVPSMDVDVLLPIGAEYHDEPRQECVFGAEGTPGEIFSRKCKGHGDEPQTEHISRLQHKRARRKSIAKIQKPTMLLADAEQFAAPPWPQLVASPPPFAPPEAGPSMVPSQSVALHPPSQPFTVPSQSIISHPLSAPFDSQSFTVPSQSVISHPPSAPFDSQPFTVPSLFVVSQPPSAPFVSQPSTIPSQSIVSHPPSASLDSQSFTVPSQPIVAPAVAFPDMSELSYNPSNSVHKRIVSSAMKAIKVHSINTQSLSSHSDRKRWIEQRLQESATQ